MSGVTIIYDGYCPLCCSYVTRLRLQRSAGDVALVDARQKPLLVARLSEQGMALDKGFVVQLNGQDFHGAKALNVLALMTSRSNFFNRINAWVFQSEKLTRLLYPLLVGGRGILLKLIGRPSIAAGTTDF